MTKTSKRQCSIQYYNESSLLHSNSNKSSVYALIPPHTNPATADTKRLELFNVKVCYLITVRQNSTLGNSVFPRRFTHGRIFNNRPFFRTIGYCFPYCFLEIFVGDTRP